MTEKRLKEKLNDYKNALERLKESLEMDISASIVLDGIIQRFEFSYELSWKIIKEYLEYQGIIEARTPRETFKEGFKSGIIDDGDAWMDMIQDRNLTSHTYSEKTALEIYKKIKSKHYDNLKKLYDNIIKEVGL